MQCFSLLISWVVSQFVVSRGSVQVWNDYPWTLNRNTDAVPSINESVSESHGSAAAIVQHESDHYWQFYYLSGEENFYGQRFDSTDHSAQGSRVMMNQNTPAGYKWFVGVRRLSSTDGFEFGFYADSFDTSSNGGVIRIFSKDGTPVTDDIIVNTNQVSQQILRGLTTIHSSNIPNGERIVVVYDDAVSLYRSYARIFEVNGTAINQIELQPDWYDWTYEPRVTGLTDGKFVATWLLKNYPSYNVYSRRAQVFDQDGSALTSVQTLSTPPSDSDYDYEIITLIDDLFLVSQTRYAVSDRDVTGSIYDASLNQCGDELVANDYTAGIQWASRPFVVQLLMPESVIVFGIAWQSHDQDESGTYVAYAQLFALDMPANGTCTENNQAYKIGQEFMVYTQNPNTWSFAEGPTAINNNGDFLIPFAGLSVNRVGYYGTAVQVYQLNFKRITVNPTTQTVIPTQFPSIATDNPTAYPTGLPTIETHNPTFVPTSNPSQSPSSTPSQAPTAHPTSLPTQFPSQTPSQSPSAYPSVSPSQHPTSVPTLIPTEEPTQYPTSFPSDFTDYPSTEPTLQPTYQPSTSDPTNTPSINPTRLPSTNPTFVPTVSPSTNPTKDPSTNPSTNPTIQPTYYPSSSPTRHPSNPPTKFATAQQSNSVYSLTNVLLAIVLGSIALFCGMLWIFTILGCVLWQSHNRASQNKMEEMIAAMQVANLHNQNVQQSHEWNHMNQGTDQTHVRVQAKPKAQPNKPKPKPKPKELHLPVAPKVNQDFKTEGDDEIDEFPPNMEFQLTKSQSYESLYEEPMNPIGSYLASHSLYSDDKTQSDGRLEGQIDQNTESVSEAPSMRVVVLHSGFKSIEIPTSIEISEAQYSE